MRIQRVEEVGFVETSVEVVERQVILFEDVVVIKGRPTALRQRDQVCGTMYPDLIRPRCCQAQEAQWDVVGSE